MLRTGGRAARDHAAVIIAYLLVALITAIYWYTASARLAAEGRIPDNLVQSIAALLSALAPATVVAYVSTEKSSTHRALRRAQDQYGQLLEERARRQAAVVNAAAMWEQAWLHAVELLAQVKAETTMAMNKEYTRFERLVLLARSKTDRAPLYEGRPPQPTGPDLGKWLADTGLLRTPQSLAQPNGELASINETLERLRPPQPPGGTWTPHGVPASNGSSGTRDRTRT